MVYEAAKDPLGTAWKVGEALMQIPALSTKIGIGIGQAAVSLAKMTPEQRQSLVDDLVNNGYTSLRDMPAADAAEAAGEIVGNLAMETVLFKGASVGGKLTLEGLQSLKTTEVGTAFLSKVNALANATAKTVGEVKVPVKATVEAVADLNGGTRPVIVTEKKSVIELMQNMEARAKQVLSGGGKTIDPKVVAEAKEKVTGLIESGDAKELKEYLDQMRNQHGSQMVSELKQTIGETAKEIYGNRKTLELDEIFGGHTIEKHVGKSDNWLRQRMIKEPDIPFASLFRNKEVANRTIAHFVKENRAEIEEWLKSGKERFEKSVSMDEQVGNVLSRGKGGAPNIKPVESNRVWISIVRDSSPQGWHVNTAFPISPSGKFKY